MKNIINGAPGVLDHGVEKRDNVPYLRTPVSYPQHVPKFFIWAQKGSTDEQLLAADERKIAYGDATFRERSPYFNHVSKFSNGVTEKGNVGMYVRLIAPDAGPKPTALVSIEILPTTVDDYDRNSDGSIKTSVTGDPVIKGQISNGHRARYLVEHFASHADAQEFAQRAIRTGTMIDPVTGDESQIIPLFDIEHSFVGGDGNLAGIRIWPSTAQNTSTLPTRLMAKEQVFPYNFSILRKNEETGNTRPVQTIMGEQSIPVSFKPEVIDPLTRVRLYVGERATREYQNLNDPRYAKEYGEIGRIHVYQENIESLLTQLHAAEVDYLDSGSDMTEDEGTKHLFNFLTGVDSRGYPYHSFVFATDESSVRWSQFTNIMFSGGSDGTMNDAVHNQLVREYMERYSDPDDELNDIAYHIESHIYDSGYELETKRRLINFISNRHDTIVVLSPNEFGQRALTPSEEFSVASSLYSEAALHPESTYFGTEVYRVLIMGSMGLIRFSEYTQRFPVTYEVAVKTAAMMGAGNGVWKEEYAFDGGDGSVITEMYDLTNPWTPSSVRARNWDAGLNFIARYDRESFNIPALKTVHRDDTSVLTGYLTACAFAYMNKVLHKAQRRFSGDQRSTHAQFTKKINDFILEEVRGKFGDRFIIVPRAQFTSMDQRRNYSWTVPVDVGAKGMKTVQTSWLVARRYEDMAGSTV